MMLALGLPTQVSTSTPSITSLVHVARGSATALGALVMANTPIALAATKSRPIRDRITHAVIALRDFSRRFNP
jgi:hypothetical protein